MLPYLHVMPRVDRNIEECLDFVARQPWGKPSESRVRHSRVEDAGCRARQPLPSILGSQGADRHVYPTATTDRAGDEVEQRVQNKTSLTSVAQSLFEFCRQGFEEE
jgi:hypothetical protein